MVFQKEIVRYHGCIDKAAIQAYAIRKSWDGIPKPQNSFWLQARLYGLLYCESHSSQTCDPKMHGHAGSCRQWYDASTPPAMGLPGCPDPHKCWRHKSRVALFAKTKGPIAMSPQPHAPYTEDKESAGSAAKKRFVAFFGIKTAQSVSFPFSIVEKDRWHNESKGWFGDSNQYRYISGRRVQ